LTRGTTANLAYVFTRSPKRADPAPGPPPPPELAPHHPNPARRPRPAPPAPPPPPPPPGPPAPPPPARPPRARPPPPPPPRPPPLVPPPAGPWCAQVPALADPERRAYLTEIAAMMDARKDRIGEHAAGHTPPWAINALGPVPGHPLDRLDWQQRASSIGAWRELSGYGDPADPIGPEPATAAPDLRAAWHEALAALGPADGPDVRGLPAGTPLPLRDP